MKPRRCASIVPHCTAFLSSTSEVFREKSGRDTGHDLAPGRSLFSLRGPLGGPAPARRGGRHPALARRHPGHSEPMVQSLLQHAAGSQFQRLRQRGVVFLRAGRDLYGAAGLPELSESVAANPLAALDDPDLSAAMAQHRQPLSHAASRRRRRQSGPAHRRRHQNVHRFGRRLRHPADRPWAPQRRGDALLVRRHLVDFVGGCAADAVRRGHPRLSGAGRADLCDHRHHAHSPDRLAVDLA